jgi:hypothetical protein
MKQTVCAMLALLGVAMCSELARAEGTNPPTPATSPYAPWANGPLSSPKYFPIAVWLQNPKNAERFREAGINLYVGLWQGPTTNQLAELKKAGMPVICEQNAVGLAYKDDSVIVGWMHGDEPDNAQGIPNLQKYGPPILPERIAREYRQMRLADPSRPVLLNLGQGVAWDNYIGRGVRRNHPEDYPEYLKGCDITSFDIYPVVHESPEIAGKLEFVAKGVERLANWAKPGKIVWNCIECTHISNPGRKANPEQIRAEVWMSLIYGSHGLIYFVHEFKPYFKEAAVLEDPVLLAAITSINRQIRELAPVLNSPDLADVTVVVAPSPSASAQSQSAIARSAGPVIAWTHKKHDGRDYLFTVNMSEDPARASFSLAGATGNRAVEVLGEARKLSLRGRLFSDEFKPYEVHLYSVD